MFLVKEDGKLDCMNAIESRYREVANSDLIPDGDKASSDETVEHIRFSDVTEGLLLRCEYYVRAELALAARARDVAILERDAALEGLRAIDECLRGMREAFCAAGMPRELIALVDAMAGIAEVLRCDPDEKESAIARCRHALDELRLLAGEPAEQPDDTASKE
ncbi:hypothetical protein [Thermophilibacter provencensis]|uniref:Uncharacterized protein n=1 Tax=Thermophilibacter provencensis TaxID=1852386 RepID=A0A921GD34_9ACTN|nr:hypothetical protein [Thermophilibacter provencensis]HJF44597.1 hypothetical protein [Thermophilibacter provencensis]